MRSRHTTAIWLGGMALALCATRVQAQAVSEPDIRDIQPFVMVIVDSSGSMEYLPNCTCSTLGCSECLPKCDLTNDTAGEPPAGKKNRWATLLEALTGKFNDFQCTKLARTTTNGMTGYDLNYSIPYHQPWSCGSSGGACAYPGPTTQQANGLLDNYLLRLRFGLMTFDGRKTYGDDLIPASDFLLNQTLSDTEPGSWSYGGPKRIHYPSCTTDYMEDWGVRGPGATEGAMISLNWTGCGAAECDMYSANAAIQDSLVRTRTFGGTPIAAALDDLYFHFKTDLKDDPYKSCRGRYAVLITDGIPDDDFRKFPSPGCDCGQTDTPPCGGTPPVNPADMKCPYPTAEQAAYDLVHGRGGDPAQMERLFVVGMSVGGSDVDTIDGLNRIASQGGSIDTDGDGNTAFFANEPDKLTATLDNLFGGLSKPVSRSVPAFSTATTTYTATQFQVSAGFQLSNDRPVAGVAAPWVGLIERRRLTCDSGGNLSAEAIDPSLGDKFQDVLNAQSSRWLWTALPTTGTIDSPRLDGPLTRGTSTSDCGTNFCLQPQFNDSAITPTLLNVADDPARTRVRDWMYGINGSVRQDKRLGDVFHSSPTIVGTPVVESGDDSFGLFRDSPIVRERPQVMYIGTNDGILHAFSMEDYPPTSTTLSVHPGYSYRAGQEIWGFVPPLMLRRLNDQISAHKFSMDATPIVKDVFFSKGTTATASDYHTVLITGMRGGGAGYMALDVTDPIDPKFLWQFTDKHMGNTYGEAEIVQAMYSWPLGGTPTLRAMAILPGGFGEKTTAGPTAPWCTGSTSKSMKDATASNAEFTTLSHPYLASTTAAPERLKHRADVRCWKPEGRALYFIDVETGGLIKKIFDTDTDVNNGTVFPSPLRGSPTAYQDAVGTVATEGFVMDADGVIWRIDLSSSDVRPTEPLAGWTVRPFHDLFWDTDPDLGETTYQRPILSLDEQRRLVLITGTGDTDAFEKPNIKNKIVSLTEIPPALSSTAPRPEDYQAAINWEHMVDDTNKRAFVMSELVTGSMSLFSGQLYAASFISVVSNTNACDEGRGRLWAFSYNVRDENFRNPNGKTYHPLWLDKPTNDAINASDAGANLFNVDVAHAEPSLLIQGLGATQRMTCQTSAENLNNYFSRSGLKDIHQSGPPAIWIVAQASSNNANRKRAGSSLGSLEMKVNRPLTFSRVMSWSGSID